MSESIYRIVYCSRNALRNSGDEQLKEVRKILFTSRKNNSACGITGALLFNSDCFAQVLEGPLEAVEATFERIQRDLRHEDVVVLETCYAAVRDFPDWSMAFSGPESRQNDAFAEFSVAQALFNPSQAAAEIREMLGSLVLQD